MRDAGDHGRVAGIAGYDVVHTVLGLVLLTAAALKAHQLATEPLAETSLFTSRWFLIGVVEFELFFGLWLLAGLYPKRTWQAALLCFSGFACVSLYKAVSGEASCGCFGKVSVNPWYALALDVAAVIAVAYWRPTRSQSPVPASIAFSRRGAAGVVVVSLIVGVLAALAMGSYEATTVSESGDIFGESEFVVLEPKSWVGKRFPLLKCIDIGEQLAQDEWIVVLYRHDCPHCQEVIPEYVRLSRVSTGRSRAQRVALIEIPPYGEGVDRMVSPDSKCIRGRLTEAKKWFVTTPVHLTLNGGVVTMVESPRATLGPAAARRNHGAQGSQSTG